jgi:glycine oxidase
MPAKGTFGSDCHADFPSWCEVGDFFGSHSIQMTGRVVIVGGGVIGLSAAWRLASAGATVTLLERDRVGAGTSRVAAGLLAPITEAGHGHADEINVQMARASLARYPSFVAELERDADMSVPLDARGTLIVSLDRDDAEWARRAFLHKRSLGLPVEWVSGERAREIEPLLSPRTNAGIWIPGDHQIDPRTLLAALARACAHRGVEMREGIDVERVLVHNGAVTGVQTAHGNIDADTVVVAAGSWSGSLAGIPDDAIPPVRPVKGQIIRLRAGDDFALAHVVRTPRVYLLSKANGSVLVGATQEEVGFDLRPTAGAVKNMLEDAWEAIPAIYELAIDGVEVGLRPASRDHLPIIGATRTRGLTMATGHFRSGILLAPVTADAIVEGIANGRFGDDMAAFSPQRFS